MYKFAKNSLKDLKKYFLFSNIFLFLRNILNLLSPLVLKYELDAFESLNYSLAFQLFILISVLIVFRTFFDYLNAYFCAKWEPQVRIKVLQEALDYVFDHSYRYFINNKVGIIIRSLSSIRKVSKVLNLYRDLFFSIIPKLILGFALAFYVNPKLAILVFTLALLFSFLTNFFSKHIKSYSYNLDLILNKFNGNIFDFISNFKVIRLFNKVNVFKKKFLKAYNQIIETFYLKFAAVRNLRFSTRYLDALIKIFVLSICSFMYLDGTISLGDIAFYMTSLRTFESSLQSLNTFLAEKHIVNSELKVSSDMIYCNYDHKLDKELKNLKLKSNKINISFKNLTFAYNKSKVLRNFNLEVRPGDKIAIVGASGSGKSTIFNLLNLLYDTPSNSIFINDQDISTLKKNDVRSLIANVSQETFVFNRSFLDNLILGDKYSKLKVKNALKKAFLWEFINSYQTGLDTMVGEKGIKLSGGELQRLAIARIILKDRPIILMDEATSDLDSKTELLIKKSLDTLFKDKIVLSIAHRLSTISNMDKIIVLNKGKIVEQGTHKDLLKLKGEYFKLWMHQKEINKDSNV